MSILKKHQETIFRLSTVVITLLGILLLFSLGFKKDNIAQGNGRPLIAVGSQDTFGIPDANGVFVDGTYAYVVTDNNSGTMPEFYIINITNPQSPQIVGMYDVNASVNKIYVSGNYAYLATKKDTEDVIVMNITNKSQPTKVIGINIPNNSEALSITGSGSNLYVGFANSFSYRELYVLNISNPANPQSINTFEIGGSVNDIAAVGSYLYLATNNSTKELTIINAAGTTNSPPIATYDLPVSGGANAVAVSNEKAYIVTDNNSSQPDFFILNAPIGPTPTMLGALDLGSSNTGVAVAGNIVYVTTQSSSQGVIKIDVANSSLPTQVSALDTGARVNDIFLAGDYLYVATAHNTKEMQIIDPQEKVLPRPNIVLVLTDDQQWQSTQYMPTVQSQLINKGINFTNGFVTTSLCCPSRSSILTGQYAHNTGVRDNRAPYGGATVFSPTSTIATWLHDAGYATAYFGKYLNNYNLISPAVPPGWDKWNVFKGDNLTGDNNYYDYTLNEDGVEKPYHVIPGDETTYGNYATDLLANRASSFIQAQTGHPFFVIYAPYAPHAPYVPAPRHDGMFASLPDWRPPSWNEPNMSDKSPWWQTLPSKWTVDSQAGVDQQRRMQIETLQSVDDGVANILNTLDTKGIANDTLVIFMSDNGISWGEHWWSNQKSCQYEECNRVPFIVRYPALLGTTPRQDSHFVLNIDLAPTLAELAGISPSSPVNGRSLVNIFNNIENNWRTDFLLEGWNFNYPKDQQPTYAGVRNAQWKYVKSNDGGSTFEELYNEVQDPYELNNVASSSVNATILSQMRTRLTQLQAE